MGVGGGVFTNSRELAEKVRHYRDWGRQANTTEPHKVKNSLSAFGKEVKIFKYE
jgi:dTDP-4-amino-4,6-dideoxygalactose transaminase